MTQVRFIFGISLSLFLTFGSCSSDSTDDSTTVDVDTVVNVQASNFTGVTITTISATLSDGTVADCYQIVTNSVPTDHAMGPWCPSNISDDASAGGIWLNNGTVHDVDGAFVQNLATFYNDNTWMMYNSSTGAITKTSTQADCEAAANPNVGAAYQNYCVECLPSYISGLQQTFIIPITPVLKSTAVNFATGPGGPASTVPSTRGVALNGIEYSAPAPVSNILAAYTIAPFDDAGGHINVHQGYHYHAATGMSTKVAQTDGHAAMIGYAMDGHAIYERLDSSGNEPTDLDSCRGHYDDVRGYHYHIDAAGNNNFINCLKGAYYVN